MSCNSCAKGFSLLRQEKGCPACGFSFCSKCLNNKVYLQKLNAEAKVCAKCKKRSEEKIDDNNRQFIPPDAYFKRLAATEGKSAENMSNVSSTSTPANIDDQIQTRLKKLKEDKEAKRCSEEEIAKRLQAIKGHVTSTSDADISTRLAKLKGVPVITEKPILPVQDLRTEQEQADDLLKQYTAQTEIDSKYNEQFESGIKSIEQRLQKLKDHPSTPQAGMTVETITKPSEIGSSHVVESEDEEETVRKIIQKLKNEASLEENELAPPTDDELPFCEICNEDATMRCLGCRYLYCRLCFNEHKDDDDGCNRYEPYQPPKGIQY